MMSNAPPLLLTHDQANRLQASLQRYRRALFASLAPSTTRNITLRTLQAMQGKLIGAIDQPTTHVHLLLNTEEKTTLKGIIAELLVLYAHEPATTERNRTLTELAALKVLLNDSHERGKRHG